MGDIQVDFNSLSELSKKLEGIALEFKEKIEQFQKSSGEIAGNNAWNGEDESEYLNTINNKYVPALIKVDNALYDYARFLNNVSQVYRTLESIMGEETIV